jgi:hypothetical protein
MVEEHLQYVLIKHKDNFTFYMLFEQLHVLWQVPEGEVDGTRSFLELMNLPNNWILSGSDEGISHSGILESSNIIQCPIRSLWLTQLNVSLQIRTEECNYSSLALRPAVSPSCTCAHHDCLQGSPSLVAAWWPCYQRSEERLASGADVLAGSNSSHVPPGSADTRQKVHSANDARIRGTWPSSLHHVRPNVRARTPRIRTTQIFDAGVPNCTNAFSFEEYHLLGRQTVWSVKSPSTFRRYAHYRQVRNSKPRKKQAVSRVNGKYCFLEFDAV